MYVYLTDDEIKEHHYFYELYKLIAEKAKLKITETTRYNPSKIECTKYVYSLLEGLNDLGDEYFAMVWANVGPKATMDSCEQAIFKIEEKFVEN